MSWTTSLIPLQSQTLTNWRSVKNRTPRIMKTIRHPADTERTSKKETLKHLSVNQCILFGEHFYSTVLSILLLDNKYQQKRDTALQKLMTGSHMVMNISKPAAFKVTYKLRKKITVISSIKTNRVWSCVCWVSCVKWLYGQHHDQIITKGCKWYTSLSSL